MICHGDLFKVYIKFSSSLRYFGKRVILVLSDDKTVGKIGNVSLESCSHLLKKTRKIETVWDMLYFSMETQNFSLQSPPFLFLFTKQD